MSSGSSPLKDRSSQLDAAVSGIESAVALFGRPEEREYHLDVRRDAFRQRARIRTRRAAEVILLIRRPSGKFLLHTKSFYPAGAYRLPSGGIEPGEDLAAAAYREAREETGLETSIERFLGILHYRFCWNGQESTFTSFLFLLQGRGGMLAAQDSSERISGYKEVSLEELSGVAQELEHSLPQDWRAWGQFRALAHRFVSEVLSEGELSLSRAKRG